MPELRKMYEIFFDPDHGDKPAYVAIGYGEFKARGGTIFEALRAANELFFGDQDRQRAARESAAATQGERDA